MRPSSNEVVAHRRSLARLGAAEPFKRQFDLFKVVPERPNPRRFEPRDDLHFVPSDCPICAATPFQQNDRASSVGWGIRRLLTCTILQG